MSAASPPTTLPARQVSESLDQGRRLLLQLVCGGYLFYLLLHMLLSAGLYRSSDQQLQTGFLCFLALLLTSVPRARFSTLSLFLTAMFLPFALYQMSSGLTSGLPPTGYLSWTPVLVLVIFAILNWKAASFMTSVLLLNIVRCLVFFPHRNPSELDAWLAMACIVLTLLVMGILISRFIEERLQSGQEVQLQLNAARRDALTQVLGRAAAEELLEAGIEQSRSTRQPLSLLVCDLDNFKAINDRHGHPAGDAVLQSAARRLRRQIGKSGQVGRWGGEEFVVILPGITKTDALMIAEQLRRALASSELAGIPVTASFGVSAYRIGDTLADLFERADQRLYEAKNAGRNVVRG
ncbi:diguanylate cyclase [Deinococcus sp.]|uniref:GGDEF domain-containing protein n=1 Tax=Deinococcus sp. TaxID=47478 RepID=UPI003CC61BAD